MANYIYAYHSSREHAPQALHDPGITCRCVIMPTFADYWFFKFTFKNGVLPIPIKDQGHLDAIGAEARAGRMVEVDLVYDTIRNDSGNVICSFDDGEFWKGCLINGLDDVGPAPQVDDKTKNNVCRDPFLDEFDWAHFTAGRSVVFLDEIYNGDDGRLGKLCRAIFVDGKLRDSFAIATCPRLGGSPQAGADASNMGQSEPMRWARAIADGRFAHPRYLRFGCRNRGRNSNMGVAQATHGTETKPVNMEAASRAIEREEHLKKARDLRATRPGRFPTPYPSMREIQRNDPTAEEDVPVEEAGVDDNGKAAKEKPAGRWFSLSAIKDCIMSTLCLGKSKSKPKGEEAQQPVLLEQPQDGGIFFEEKQGERISALDEDKDKVVVSIEPVEPSSSESSSGEEWDEEEPEIQPSSWFDRNHEYAYRRPPPSIIYAGPPRAWPNAGEVRFGRRQQPQDRGVVEEERPREGVSALGEDKGKGREAASVEPLKPPSSGSSGVRRPGEKWPSSWFERNPEYAPPGSCPSRLAWEKANPDWATRPPPPRERRADRVGQVISIPGLGQARYCRGQQQPQDGGIVEPSSSESSRPEGWEWGRPRSTWRAPYSSQIPFNPCQGPRRPFNNGIHHWVFDDEGHLHRRPSTGL